MGVGSDGSQDETPPQQTVQPTVPLITDGDHICATAWVLSVGQALLTEETQSQIRGEDGTTLCRGALDSCFNSLAVCGTRRWTGLRTFFSKKGCPPQRLSNSNNRYRFGGGSAVAVQTWRITVGVGNIVQEVDVDVIKGALPLLLGTEFGNRFCLTIDLESKVIYQKTGGRFVLIDSYHGDSLPSIAICPEVRGSTVSSVSQFSNSDQRSETWHTLSTITGTPQYWGYPNEADSTDVGSEGDDSSSQCSGSSVEVLSDREDGDGGGNNNNIYHGAYGPEVKPQKKVTFDVAPTDGEGGKVGTDVRQEEQGQTPSSPAKVKTTPSPTPTPSAKRNRDRRKPKVLTLSDTEIRKIHQRGHRPAETIIKFFKASVKFSSRSKTLP